MLAIAASRVRVCVRRDALARRPTPTPQVQTADLAKALSKLDTSLGANGQVIAAINRAFNKAEGAPVPEATALLSSIRTHMSVLVSTVGGKTERMEIVINELEGYLSERDERLETTAAGLPKILQTLYDTDVLDEDVIMAWWGDVTGQTDALEAAVEPAAAYAQKVEKDLETANKNVKDAEARLEQCKKDAKLASKEVDNARTGGNPTSEEQLREKEARRMDKVCQSALANAKPKCVACQKIAGELFNELPKAQEAAKAAELAAKANKRITELCKPLIDWLAEDDDDSSDSDSD